MLHLRKSITLHVSVPVLSEKMFEICPSSSFSAIVRTLHGVSVGAWYIWRSHSMKRACQNLTNVIET